MLSCRVYNQFIFNPIASPFRASGRPLDLCVRLPRLTERGRPETGDAAAGTPVTSGRPALAFSGCQSPSSPHRVGGDSRIDGRILPSVIFGLGASAQGFHEFSRPAVPPPGSPEIGRTGSDVPRTVAGYRPARLFSPGSLRPTRRHETYSLEEPWNSHGVFSTRCGAPPETRARRRPPGCQSPPIRSPSFAAELLMPSFIAWTPNLSSRTLVSGGANPIVSPSPAPPLRTNPGCN